MKESAYEKQAASLEKAYGWLDTVLRTSHFLLRRPIDGKYVQAKFRTEHPFKIADKTLAICGGGPCFYEENLPEYAKASRPDSHA